MALAVAEVVARPRLLDLFSGAGGCAAGYKLAGFEVIGVDIQPQPNYAGDAFFQRGALGVLEHYLYYRDVPGVSDWPFGGSFDAIHASPPCQAHTALATVHADRRYPDFLAPVRDLLAQTGLPYIIENVPGAPMTNAYVLCGGGFGLGAGDRHLQRHRLFEIHGFELGLVPPCSHFGKEAIGVYGHGSGAGRGFKGNAAQRRESMGIDWMTRDELSQAIPPAYTEFIGSRLFDHLRYSVVPQDDAPEKPEFGPAGGV